MKKMPPPVAVKSKLNLTEKKGGKNVGFVSKAQQQQQQQQQQPVCPKPLRPASSVPPLVLARCSIHRNSCDAILSLIEDSRAVVPGHNRRNNEVHITGAGHDQSGGCCSCCSTPYYSGSPPGRTNNPLVYDQQFVHQMEMLSPFSCKNLQDKSTFTSTSSSPV